LCILDVSYIDFRFGKQESLNSNFNLTEEIFFATHTYYYLMVLWLKYLSLDINQLRQLIPLCEYLVESINWNFKLTKAKFYHTYMVLSFYIMIDIFVAVHDAPSSNGNSLWMSCGIVKIIEKYFKMLAYFAFLSKCMTKKYHKTYIQDWKGKSMIDSGA